MPEPSSHRATILAGIRHALGSASSPEAIAAEYAALPRTYRRETPMDREALVAFFEDRLHEYDAGIYKSTPSAIASSVAAILTKRAKQSLAIAPGTPADWLPSEFQFAIMTGADADPLNQSQGILTGCTVAIAETGSIVLQNAPAQGARILSLVPDYHLCIVFVSQIVAQVPEAFVRLASTSTLPTTFISGPSATADIEMTRIKGVHGPRFLDVLIVEDAS